MDFKFNWDASLEIGHSLFDAQHKELFRIGRDIEQLLLTNSVTLSPDQLLNIICELRTYVTYHFYEEEKIMLEINYPYFSAHKHAHDVFTNQIKALNFDADNLYDSAKTIKELLQTWVFEHILIEDHALKGFIK